VWDWLRRRRDKALDDMLLGPNTCPHCNYGYVQVPDPRTGDWVPDICLRCHGTGQREEASKNAPGRKR
jgi:hypothetical protein